MKFIVVSGADACGKDTQIERLKAHFLNQNIKTQFLCLDSSLESLQGFWTLNSPDSFVNAILLQFEPIARTLFLQSLIKNTLDKIERDTDVVIFNGYWYKYAASEAAYGIPLSFWSSAASQYFPKPDVSIYLDVPFEHCLKRRQHWTPYESGKARYWGGRPLSHEDFQKAIHQNFRLLYSQIPDSVFQIDGNHDEDQVARNILSLFDESPMPKSTELFISGL